MLLIKKAYRWLYKATSRRDERGEPFSGFVESAVRENAIKICRGASGKILDIGCGCGLFSARLAAENPGAEVWGVDTNIEYLKKAGKRAESKGLTNTRFVLQDAEALSFDENYFDVVVCINLSLSISRALMINILKEMRRVCKVGGHVIFDFRNSGNKFFELKYKLVRYYDSSSPYPLNTYDLATVSGLVKELGLEILNKRRIGFPYNSLAPILMLDMVKK